MARYFTQRERRTEMDYLDQQRDAMPSALRNLQQRRRYEMESRPKAFPRSKSTFNDVRYKQASYVGRKRNPSRSPTFDGQQAKKRCLASGGVNQALRSDCHRDDRREIPQANHRVTSQCERQLCHPGVTKESHGGDLREILTQRSHGTNNQCKITFDTRFVVAQPSHSGDHGSRKASEDYMTCSNDSQSRSQPHNRTREVHFRFSQRKPVSSNSTSPSSARAREQQRELEVKEPRDPREPREPRDPRQPRDPREPRERVHSETTLKKRAWMCDRNIERDHGQQQKDNNNDTNDEDDSDDRGEKDHHQVSDKDDNNDRNNSDVSSSKSKSSGSESSDSDSSGSSSSSGSQSSSTDSSSDPSDSEDDYTRGVYNKLKKFANIIAKKCLNKKLKHKSNVPGNRKSATKTTLARSLPSQAVADNTESFVQRESECGTQHKREAVKEEITPESREAEITLSDVEVEETPLCYAEPKKETSEDQHGAAEEDTLSQQSQVEAPIVYGEVERETLSEQKDLEEETPVEFGEVEEKTSPEIYEARGENTQRTLVAESSAAEVDTDPEHGNEEESELEEVKDDTRHEAADTVLSAQREIETSRPSQEQRDSENAAVPEYLCNSENHAKGETAEDATMSDVREAEVTESYMTEVHNATLGLCQEDDILRDTEYINNYQDHHDGELYSTERYISNPRIDTTSDTFMFSTIESAYAHMYPDDQAAPQGAHHSSCVPERAHSSHSCEPPALEPTFPASPHEVQPPASALLYFEAVMEPRFPALPQHGAPQPQRSTEVCPQATTTPQRSTEVCPQATTTPQQHPNAPKAVFPTPPQSQVTGRENRSGPSQCESNESLLDLLQSYITCSVCKTGFNRTPICRDYLIKLNRPVQCVCGCVICTICYKDKQCCSVHGLVSYHGTVNTIVSNLASCCYLDKGDEWDLKRDHSDSFKTEAQLNSYIQEVMNNEESPDCDKLKSAFNRLINSHDTMSFKYWVNSPLPENVAYRYVCLPHIPGFWDHIVVGTHLPHSVEKMIMTQDEFLPKLFNVKMDSLGFHWCCFVFAEQVILAMWCTSADETRGVSVLPLHDTNISSWTSCKEFRCMVYCLFRWFTVQYGQEPHRQVRIVLDCMPSESPTFVHILSLIAAKCGMNAVDLRITQERAHNDLNYTFNRKYADNLFNCPDLGDGPKIDIVEDFTYYHNTCAGMTRVYTTTEQYRLL